MLSRNKILVTGATGFIGQNLIVNLLQNKDTQPIALIRKNSQAKLFTKSLETRAGDLLDFHSLENSLEGVDTVINLAAGLPHHKLSDKQYLQVNVEGVENLLKASLKAKVRRFVHVSTVGIYGTFSYNLNEKSPLRPSDSYSQSKVLGEQKVLEYRNKGLPITIIRPTIAFGPRDTRPGFYNLFKFISKGFFVPLGDGKNYFHTVYMDNLVDGLLLASHHRKAFNNDFIIGDDPCPTMEQIWNTMAKVLNKKLPPIYLPKSLAYALSRSFDQAAKFGIPQLLSERRVNFIVEPKKYKIDKAKTILGYHPKVNIEEGLAKTYLWYKQNGYLK